MKTQKIQNYQNLDKNVKMNLNNNTLKFQSL